MFFDKEVYKCRFRNLIFNYPSSLMPMRLYGPANTFGILNDHTYSERSPGDFFKLNYIRDNK